MTKEQWAKVQADARSMIADRLAKRESAPKLKRQAMIDYIVNARVAGESGRGDTLMKRQYAAWKTADLRTLYLKLWCALN